jgi:cytochrome c peroxidase
MPRRPSARALLVTALLGLLPAGLLALPRSGENADRPAALAPLPPVPVSASDPLTPEKVELGKLLFFDPRLSSAGPRGAPPVREARGRLAEARRHPLGR